MVSSMKSKKRNLFFDYLLIFIIGFIISDYLDVLFYF